MFDLVVRYPIVRFAIEPPIADRWPEGDGFAVIDQLPPIRTKWRHHFSAAAAGAKMDRQAMVDRDI